VTRRAVVLWSGGKDSAHALHRLRGMGELEPVALLTTVDEEDGTVVSHGVPVSLVRAQAEALGLPLAEAPIPPRCPNPEYERRLRAALGSLRADGVVAAVAGDIALEDVRAYRQRLLEGAGLSAHFPLWGEDPAALARAFLGAGFRAVVARVDPDILDPSFVGAPYDAAFLRDLPPGVDPCGENGEFHTFVQDGPGFRRGLKLRSDEGRGLREGRDPGDHVFIGAADV
jgi:uncharacterized protein (TIGR00290 family)